MEVSSAVKNFNYYRRAFKRLLDRFVMRLTQQVCSHEFAIEDLKKINDGVEPRVKWPCYKCKKIFYAHCGLDISPKFGKTFRRQPYNK